MILQERTRIYTNNNGQYEKVDILKSYRKINASPSILHQLPNNGSGLESFFFAFLRAFIIVVGLFGFVTVIYYGFQTHFSTHHEILDTHQMQYTTFSVDDFSKYLQSSQGQVMLQDYLASKPQLISNYQQYFYAELRQRLQCSWKQKKVQCRLTEPLPDITEQRDRNQYQ